MHMPRFLGIRSPSLTLFITEAVQLNNRRRSLKFDDIAFRIRDVDGRTLPFSAVTRLREADDYSMRLKFAANGGLVERFYSKAKVIKIFPFNAWGRAASTSQLAVDWHKVNQRSAGPQLHQTYRLLSALDRASKHITVKVEHSVQMDDAQYQMINIANANHASILIESIAARKICPPLSQFLGIRCDSPKEITTRIPIDFMNQHSEIPISRPRLIRLPLERCTLPEQPPLARLAVKSNLRDTVFHPPRRIVPHRSRFVNQHVMTLDAILCAQLVPNVRRRASATKRLDDRLDALQFNFRERQHALQRATGRGCCFGGNPVPSTRRNTGNGAND